MRWPFSRGPARAEAADRPPGPLCAYVTRRDPPEYEGFPLPRKLGRIDDIIDVNDDLEGRVAGTAGGGEYVARLFEQRDKRAYRGTHTFRIPGAPLIDGEPVLMPGAPGLRDPRLREIQREQAKQELLIRLDEARARRIAARRMLDELDRPRRPRRRPPGPPGPRRGGMRGYTAAHKYRDMLTLRKV